MFHDQGHLMVLPQVNLVIRHILASLNHQANLLGRGNLVALISQVNLFNRDNLHKQFTLLIHLFIPCRSRISLRTQPIQLNTALLISSPFDRKVVITLKVNIDPYTMCLKVLLITLNRQAILIFRN